MYGEWDPGHSAVLHACTVEDEAFVGMGATLLDGVVVEKGAFVAAGAMVTENTRIPSGQVALPQFILLKLYSRCYFQDPFRNCKLETLALLCF